MAAQRRITAAVSLCFVFSLLLPIVTRADVQCEEQADIVFVVDSSRSIRDSEAPDGTTDNWQLVLEFVAEAVKGLPVDNDEVRIGVLTYSSEIDRDSRIHLGSYSDKDDLLEKISNLPYIGKNTNTAAALKYTHTRMFASYGRAGVRKVAILITDGISNIEHENTVINARDAKNNDDIIIFTLGITKYASVGELEDVASDPAAYYHFYSKEFEHLNLLLDQLLIRLCKPKPPAVGCNDLVADLTIILDSSGSIKDKSPDDDPTFYWKQLKTFAMKIVEALEVTPDKTRVALVRFGSTASVSFYLNSFTNTRDVVNVISELQYQGGKTNTSGAVRTMRKRVYQETKGDRPGVLDIGIIITDGESNVDEHSTEYEARRLEDYNIRMFGVGVTEKINRHELETIVSEPEADHIFNTTRFEDIDNLVSRLVWRVCHEECILEENETGQSRCTSRTEETACDEGYSLHWRKYPDQLLVGHNYARIDHVQTPSECQRLCVEDSRCRSIDYVRPFQECAVSYDTKDENPRSFVEEEGVDYYEWYCWDGKGNPDTIPGGSSSGEGGSAGGSTSGPGIPGKTYPTFGPGERETTTKKGKGSKGAGNCNTVNLHWMMSVLLAVFAALNSL